MDSKSKIQGRIVSGTIMGPDGFSFKVPYGFKVYDEEAAEETPSIEVIKTFADRYLINENGSRVSVFSIMRLGKEYYIYTVLGISSEAIRDSAIYSGRDILTKMELE